MSTERAKGSPRLTFENTVGIYDTGVRSRKTHNDSPEGMYEEINDNERRERGMGVHCV